MLEYLSNNLKLEGSRLLENKSHQIVLGPRKKILLKELRFNQILIPWILNSGMILPKDCVASTLFNFS